MVNNKYYISLKSPSHACVTIYNEDLSFFLFFLLKMQSLTVMLCYVMNFYPG